MMVFYNIMLTILNNLLMFSHVLLMIHQQSFMSINDIQKFVNIQ